MFSSGKRPHSDHNSEEAGPSAKTRAPIKTGLLKLYGKNNLPNNKLRALDSFSKGKDFGAISRELRVQRATAEVYTIDAFAAGKEIDPERLPRSCILDCSSYYLLKTASTNSRMLK